MAYQVMRKNRIVEELQLCHNDGSVAASIQVDLNVDTIASRVQKTYDALGAAQAAIEKDPESPKLLEAYGDAIVAVFRVIFGDDGTDKILAYYEDNYTEMLLDIFPFINGEIMPKIRDASEARKQQLIEAARMVKKGGKHGFGK